MLYPMKMRPAFKDYLWGGDRLAERYGKDTQLRPVAESWEISSYPSAPSVVDNGELEGLTLPEVLKRYPKAVGGGASASLPVLVKLIDAKKPLSLQVHPDNAYARRVENESGKNEMWYIVDCDPTSELVVGMREPLSKEEIRRAIADDTIMDKVRRVPVAPGDCYMIPAGLIHAIGEGCLIAEIQQSSDVTYRVYDYNRKGPDGKPRELHVEKAVDVIDCALSCDNRSLAQAVQKQGYTERVLCDWPYFNTSLLEVESDAALCCDAESFACLTVLGGEPEILWKNESLPLKMADSVFLPAGLGDFSLRGKARVLLTTK